LVVLNTNHWDLRRWSVDKLKDELTSRNVHFNTDIGRDGLVNLLEQEMREEMQISEELVEDFSKININE
jgi:hypothetical protein